MSYPLRPRLPPNCGPHSGESHPTVGLLGLVLVVLPVFAAIRPLEPQDWGKPGPELGPVPSTQGDTALPSVGLTFLVSKALTWSCRTPQGNRVRARPRVPLEQALARADPGTPTEAVRTSSVGPQGVSMCYPFPDRGCHTHLWPWFPPVPRTHGGSGLKTCTQHRTPASHRFPCSLLQTMHHEAASGTSSRRKPPRHPRPPSPTFLGWVRELLG